MTSDVRGLIGMAQRAGKCVSGAELCERTAREGGAKLLLIDEAASENMYDRILSLAHGRSIPLLVVPDLGGAIGKAGRMVCAVNDQGLAEAILRKHTLLVKNPGV